MKIYNDFESDMVDYVNSKGENLLETAFYYAEFETFKLFYEKSKLNFS